MSTNSFLHIDLLQNQWLIAKCLWLSSMEAAISSFTCWFHVSWSCTVLYISWVTPVSLSIIPWLSTAWTMRSIAFLSSRWTNGRVSPLNLVVTILDPMGLVLWFPQMEPNSWCTELNHMRSDQRKANQMDPLSRLEKWSNQERTHEFTWKTSMREKIMEKGEMSSSKTRIPKQLSLLLGVRPKMGVPLLLWSATATLNAGGDIENTVRLPPS